ncbi:MAG: 4Fe-4S dicluster domain-containing protein, partial [Dehalococcoidales bacterium]
MTDNLPVWIIEPDPVEKWNQWSNKFSQSKTNPDAIQESIDIDALKQQLKEIRQYSKDNNNQLTKELEISLSQRYPGVNIQSAFDSAEAINHIKQIANGIKNISVNNSRSVTQELKPGLISDGFTVIDSYYDEINAEELQGVDYWEMPRLLANDLTGSFDVSVKLTGISPNNGNSTKEYIAVLGVNAASADDATVLFLQHFRNIYNDLKTARKIILVIGLDKIVRNRDDAVFQTKCMGIFGAEGLLLDIQPKSEGTPSVADLPDYPGGDRELHVILLDNNRTGLLESEYSDYFMCIGCRACTGSCPAKLSEKPLSPKLLIFKLKQYLSQVSPELLQGKAEKFPAPDEKTFSDEPIIENEVWACTTCQACQNVCPVELEHTKAVVDLRRNLVMISTSQAARDPLRNIRQRGHPWTGTV